MKVMHRYKYECILFLLFVVLYAPVHAWAGRYHDTEYYAPIMDRPVVSISNAGVWELWAQFDRFAPALDVFNFAAKSGTTSRITGISAYTLGLGYNPTDRINVRYNFQLSDQAVSRTSEPFQINSRFIRHEARIQYAFYSDYPWRFTIETGLRAHFGRKESFQRIHAGAAKAGKLTFKKAGSLNFNNLNSVWSSSNPSFPVLTEQTKDFAYLVAVRGRYEPVRSLDIDFGVELRRVRIGALFSSPALNHAGPILGKALLASAQNKVTEKFPQTTPWSELHVLLQASLTWHPWEGVTLAADWTHYQIKRQGYNPKGSTANFTSSEQFDAYMMMRMMDGLTMYVHGRASTRFVLGDQPLGFNSRTSKLFKNPFGSVSVGMALTF